MRVLYFSRDYTTHDLRFLAALAESGLDVRYLRLENDGVPYESRSLPPGIEGVDWGGGRCRANTPESWFHLMPDFESVLDQVHPDLVHAGPVQSCGFMTALAGFHPFLVMSWGSDVLVDADRDPLWRWMTRYTLRRADIVVCDSSAVRQKVQTIVPYADERIVQFPWGIDLQVFQPSEDGSELRARLGWHDAKIIVSTRAWESLYGIDIVLEAFRLVHQQEPTVRLLLLGSGSMGQAVADFVARHGLERAVYCPGQISHEDSVSYFQASDAYLSCAHSDGTSVSLLEALAVGLPVVVTDIASNREWVKSGVNGWLGEDKKVQSFANALLKAVRLSEQERITMRHDNRKVAASRADWNRNVRKLLDAYDGLIQPTTTNRHRAIDVSCR